jgi:hypothetical protein
MQIRPVNHPDYSERGLEFEGAFFGGEQGQHISFQPDSAFANEGIKDILRKKYFFHI